MLNTHSAVIFDMDGLLVDSEPLYMRAWQEAASELGFQLSKEAYFSLLGLPENTYYASLIEILGDDFPLSAFRDRWKEIWLNFVEGGELRAKAGACDLLRSLRDAGVPLALATSSSRDYAKLSLERTGLAVYFEHVLTAEDVANGKPAPDLFQLAASRIRVAASQCLVLEDSPNGIEAGLAAGMSVIIVPDLVEPTAESVERAHMVVANLEEAKPHVLRAVCGLTS